MRGRVLALLGAAAVVLSGCGFHGLYGVNLPGGTDVGNNPYTVTVYFANVLDLVPQSNVKVNDVAVGKVEAISLASRSDKHGAGGWAAKVKLQVRGDVDLPENARAEVQQTSLLGEKYVALLQPFGTASTKRLHNGSIIPLEHTASAPEVEEVLGALSLILNGGGIQQIQTITHELNLALSGHEDVVRDLLGQFQTFTSTLNTQKEQIVAALDSLANLSNSLNAQKSAIVETLDTMPQALKVLADEKDRLVTMLQALTRLGSVATDVVTKTETGLVRSLQALNPTLVQLSEAGANLPTALKILGTFPFPVGPTLEFVRGDYANLHLYLNLNLQDELCALLGLGCPTKAKPANPHSAKQSSSATQQSANSSAADPLPPMLIGAGR
jgi:phospholipid/cholesterol/gamma-HCH transport system substrate-binding protein